MITIVALVVLVLATSRLIRVVTRDKIFAPVSDWVTRKFGAHSFLAGHINCHWCAGVSISAATTAYALICASLLYKTLTFTNAAAIWLLLWPAVAYAASWIVDKEVNDGVSQ